jgi:hypothetical protein
MSVLVVLCCRMNCLCLCLLYLGPWLSTAGTSSAKHSKYYSGNNDDSSVLRFDHWYKAEYLC